jgi:16S rRNA (cytidine1402-2'-O)-methyltransferase
MNSCLYIVGTPIGNLKDITLRAIDVLKSVDLIACEDTRRTKTLLDRYSIRKPTTSYHKFNIKAKTKHLIGQLKLGKNIALVSDSGMPGISDPGQELIQAAAQAGIKIEVVPGPSAAISAISVSGIGTGRFVFEGFLPTGTADRKKRLQALAKEGRTVILYEAPHRLVKTLTDLYDNLGDRYICIARELTKKFEEQIRGSVSEMIDKFVKVKPRGEFVIVIEGKEELEERGEIEVKRLRGEEVKKLMGDLIGEGVSKSRVVKILAKRLNVPKNQLYRETLNI